MQLLVPIGIISGVLLLVGFITMLASQANVRRRKRILATPTTRIAQARGGADVEVKGRIQPSEQGVIVGPFSGRQGVYVRVVVEEYRSSGKSGSWRRLFDQAEAREFLVDDGSGELARVVPHGAHFVLDRSVVQSSGTFQDASPQVEAFLNAYGMKSTSWLGFNKRMRYQEEMLAAGDPLYAIGPSMRRPGGPPVFDGYRTVPGSVLVMYGGPGAQELILTNKAEEELVGDLRTGFITGVVLVVLGGIGALVFLVVLAGVVVTSAR